MQEMVVVARVGPDLYQEAGLAPCAADAGGGFGGAAGHVVRDNACDFGGVGVGCSGGGVDGSAGFQEDGFVEVGVETVVFGREAAVVETDWLGGGEGVEDGGGGGAVRVGAWGGDGGGEVAELV